MPHLFECQAHFSATYALSVKLLTRTEQTLNKEEALAAVRYGADKVFRATGNEITDADIDTILASAKDLTKEREKALANATLEDKKKRDLLDFSDANVNFQEFDGVDYKSMRDAKQEDVEFMSLMQVAPPPSTTLRGPKPAQWWQELCALQ